jgi:hypothetical protein
VFFFWYVVDGTPMHVTDFSRFPTPNPEGSAMIRCRCWDPKAYREAMSDREIGDDEFWAEAGHVADEEERKYTATTAISRRISLPAPVPSESSAELSHQATPLSAAIISIGLHTDAVLDLFQLDDSLIPRLHILVRMVRSSRWESTLRTPEWGLSYEQAAKLSHALLADITNTNLVPIKVIIIF